MPPHGAHQGLTGHHVAGPGIARVDPLALDIGQSGDIAVGTGQQGQRLLIEAKQAAQLVIGSLSAEGAGAMECVVEHV